jgi:hypothetical protein
MLFELILLALIDDKEPMIIKRYGDQYSCNLDAAWLPKFVENNYTEIRLDSEKLKSLLLTKLAEFHLKWGTEQIPGSLVDDTDAAYRLWAEQIAEDAAAADLEAIVAGKNFQLANDALLLGGYAMDFLENENRSEVAKEADEYALDASRVEYVCLAAPQ